jgi:hypothetical protein
VQACIQSLPAPQRAIAKRFDALIARTLPGIQRCIKWGMSDRALPRPGTALVSWADAPMLWAFPRTG